MRNSAIGLRVYLMHASRARSLKRDGRDHSPSMKQPAVVPSALSTVLNALTYLKVTAQCHVPKSLDFYFDKAWRF